jgi:hypothetical protein
MTILAIDPGTTESGYVLWNPTEQKPIEFGKWGNDDLLKIINSVADPYILAIEKPANMGNYFGDSLIDTCIWIGRIIESSRAVNPILVKRHEVKMHLCHRMKGVNDSVIRAAIIDRFGGKDKAVGVKTNPGVFYGMKADVWQALAVALVVQDRRVKPL